MKAVEAPETIEPWRIICAAQSEPDYSEERYMLIYAGDRSDDYYGKGYILLKGWHCSCYDWPEVDWDATHYEEDELLKIADMRKRRRGLMSYDIRLCDPVTHETLEVDSPHLMAGGTYALGGTTELWLNVTYNYARHYRCLGERGIREIYGKTGAESIPMLKAAALRLGDDVSDDYWEATEGNAKRALLQLLAMARMRPDGVWDGD